MRFSTTSLRGLGAAAGENEHLGGVAHGGEESAVLAEDELPGDAADARARELASVVDVDHANERVVLVCDVRDGTTVEIGEDDRRPVTRGRERVDDRRRCGGRGGITR